MSLLLGSLFTVLLAAEDDRARPADTEPSATSQTDTTQTDASQATNGGAEPETDLNSVLSFVEQEEVVTISSRMPVKLRETLSSVWLINRATIERMGAVSLGDILRIIPGMHTNDIAPGWTETSTRFPLYAPDNQTLLLVDGRSLQFDGFGTNDKSGIDINDIERIEVVQGPSSTLYGAGAYAGVINVITKKPDNDSTTGTVLLRSGVGTGSNGSPRLGLRFSNYAHAFADANIGLGSAALRLSVGAEYLPSFGTSVVAFPGGRSITEPARRLSGAADFSTKIGEWELRTKLTGLARRFILTIAATQPATFQDYSWSLNAVRKDAFFRGDELSIQTWARFIDYALPYELPPHRNVDFSVRQISGELFAQYRTPRFYNNQMVIGAQARLYNLDTQRLPANARFQQFYGIFAEDNWRPIEQLQFTAGIRVETNENAVLKTFRRLSVSPRLAAGWVPSENHALRLEFATAFRNPTPYETFLVMDNADNVPLVRGNRNLGLELMQQLTLGYRGKFGIFAPSVEAYLARIQDVVYPETIAATAPETELLGFPVTADYQYRGRKLPVVFKNSQDYFLPGASVKLALEPSPYFKTWLWYAITPYFLNHQLGISGEFTWEKLSLSIQIYFKEDALSGTDYTPQIHYGGQIFTNASLTYFITPQWTVRLSGTNLTDFRFWTKPSGGAVRMALDDILGERIGPRAWLEARYNFGK